MRLPVLLLLLLCVTNLTAQINVFMHLLWYTVVCRLTDSVISLRFLFWRVDLFVLFTFFSVTLEGPCTHFSTGLHVLQEAYLNQGNTALMLRDLFYKLWDWVGGRKRMFLHIRQDECHRFDFSPSPWVRKKQTSLITGNWNFKIQEYFELKLYRYMKVWRMSRVPGDRIKTSQMHLYRIYLD